MGINPRNLQIRPGHGLVAGFFATSISCAGVFFGGIITTTLDNYACFRPRFFIVVLGMTFFFMLHILFPFYFWDFYFPFFFRLLFLFSFWTFLSLFYLDFLFPISLRTFISF